MPCRPLLPAFASMALALASCGGARASDCTVTSVGFTPLNDLGPGYYVVGTASFQGGLYPGGVNTAPAAHYAEGRARAIAIAPLNTAGVPDAAGKYVFLSIGMSNTTQEFCSMGGSPPCDSWTFMAKSAAHPVVNHTEMAIANGAYSGQAAATWDAPTDLNYDRVRDTVLTPQGLSEAQVVAVWIKVANPGPSVKLPNPAADAYILKSQTGNILRAAKTRYPNLKLAFLSSRIYAGYAGYPVPFVSALNPEPYAYESGLAAKWLIEAQINQMAGGPVDPLAGDLNYSTVVPWVGWGPYLWADGTTPRSDGLAWTCGDLDGDGTHPATSGEQKVADQLLAFMLSSPYAMPWFAICEPADVNNDHVITLQDIPLFVGVLLNPGNHSTGQRCAADVNRDERVNSLDIHFFVRALLGG